MQHNNFLELIFAILILILCLFHYKCIHVTGTQRSLCTKLGLNRDSFHTQKTGNEKHDSKERKVHRRFTWKTQRGKNHGSPQAANCHYVRMYNSEFTEATTSCSHIFATGGGYNRGNDLFLSLSLSLYTITCSLFFLHQQGKMTTTTKSLP